MAEPWQWATTAQRFRLEVDGVEIGTFLEVQGLQVSAEPATFAEGGQNHFTHQRPGRMSWPNITLKRGVTQNNELFDWFTKTSGDGYAGEGNKVTLTSAAITLIDEKGLTLRSWALDRAFPIRWEGPDFSVKASEVPTEQLEMAHHGFRPA